MQESLSCTRYIPLSSILEIFTFISHTCSIKNDPKSYVVGFAQWEINIIAENVRFRALRCGRKPNMNR